MTPIYSITGETLYQSSHQSLKEAVEAAVADGVSLKNANLAYADLSDANMKHASLRNANLHNANLRRANLRGANLRGADLHNANLAYADLSGANLHNASLYCTNLLYASLTDVNLATALANYAIFAPDTLKDATFDGYTITSATTFGPLGSRNDNLPAVQTVNGLRFKTGCFTGTKEELLDAVESTHSDSQRSRDYKLAVEFLENYLKGRED